MNVQEQLQTLVTSLAKLGWRRLTALGLIGVTVFAIVGVSGYYLSRPSQEVLYAGLDRQDVSGIGAALTEAAIPFDVSSDGTTIMVRYAQTAQARMLLAEKGLPHSTNSGYELYDKLGSLGLTSFMQDVTRVRALEGELARTIQTMNGVRAARVHLVMPDEGSFRRARQPPSASVMIRTDTVSDARMGQAIRHLVAAALPGMTVDQVTVLNTDGSLLSSGGDLDDLAAGKMLTLEKTVSKDIQDSVRKELAPYLGLHNFQISVAAKLNTDNRQTAETTYDPDSRVERSTRVVKENNTVQNNSSQAPTSVATALPQETKSSGDSKVSNTDNSKREELTNYEVSSKTVTTTSGGYTIDHMSIAILVNKATLAATTPVALSAKLADIESLVTSASGLRKDRGDTIKVLAEDFADAGHDLEPVPSASIVDTLMHQSGTAINALAAVVVAVLLIMFGLRPLTRALIPGEPEMAALAAAPVVPALEAPAGMAAADGGPVIDMRQEPNLIEDVTNRPRRSPQRRLEQMVEFDETQAATILKQWVAARASPDERAALALPHALRRRVRRRRFVVARTGRADGDADGRRSRSEAGSRRRDRARRGRGRASGPARRAGAGARVHHRRRRRRRARGLVRWHLRRAGCADRGRTRDDPHQPRRGNGQGAAAASRQGSARADAGGARDDRGAAARRSVASGRHRAGAGRSRRRAPRARPVDRGHVRRGGDAGSRRHVRRHADRDAACRRSRRHFGDVRA